MHKFWTEQEKKRLVQLLKEGRSVKEAAYIMDRSPAASFKWAARLMPRETPRPKTYNNIVKHKKYLTTKAHRDNPEKFWDDHMEDLSFANCSQKEAKQLLKIRGCRK